MLQNPNAPQSGNSTGLVMGGINLTSYPRDLLSEIEENFRDTSRPITIIFEDGKKEVCEVRSDRRGATPHEGGERVTDKKLLTDFASALEQAAALARKIADQSDLRVELKLDAETFGRVVYRASRDNPGASAPSTADS